MAFCPNCGAQNEDGAKFCANCAAQLSDDTQQYNAGYGNQQFNPGDFAASAMVPEKKLNIISVVAILVMFIAMFLPYYTVKAMGYSESASFFKLGWETGWFLCLLCILMVVAALLLSIVKMTKATLAPLVLFFIFYLILAIMTGKDAADAGVTSGSIMGITVKAGFGFGFWLTWVALVVSAAAPFVEKFLHKAPAANNNYTQF